MKILYCSVNGRTYAEDMNPDVKLVEENDGLHPLQPGNVFVNDLHETTSWGADDSLTVIWQGISSPESYCDGLTKEFVDRQLKDDFIIKAHHQKQSISRKFWRTIVNTVSAGVMLGMAIGISVVCILLFYAVAVIFL